jgi:hypothetical protein
MTRLLFLTHRYFGIAVGPLMVMWCLSGIVMMYVSYPDLAEDERVRHLAPIDWNGCCKLSDAALPDDTVITEAQIEMLADRPVLRLQSATESRLLDLRTGLAIGGVSPKEAAEAAQSYSEGSPPATPRFLETVDHDQWTVSESFHADRPLYRFALNQGTELYISSATGRAVQMTTTGERFWNWLGAIPHWLYFTELRERPTVWSNVVIATSLMGALLSALGLYIGVTQFIQAPEGGWSPYEGFKWWHHIAGLIFGLFVLTWITSGFLSMNPWGWLEGQGAQAELRRLRGNQNIVAADLKRGLAAFARLHPPEVAGIKMAPLAGHLYFVSSTRNGERGRFDDQAMPAPLDLGNLKYIQTVVGGDDASAASLMTREDSYYFSHHRDLAPLPVYRMILRDGTHYYFDTVSGALIAKMDRGARGYRWLHLAPHRLDFSAALRGRPQWDGLMLVLLSGVTVLCATGTYLGYRRLVRMRSSNV